MMNSLLRTHPDFKFNLLNLSEQIEQSSNYTDLCLDAISKR